MKTQNQREVVKFNGELVTIEEVCKITAKPEYEVRRIKAGEIKNERLVNTGDYADIN